VPRARSLVKGTSVQARLWREALSWSLSPEQLEALFYLFGIVPARYTHPEWALAIGFPIDSYWPFITSMFLHGGFLRLMSLYPQPVRRQPGVEYLPISRRSTRKGESS
jgi:hypothetical protein